MRPVLARGGLALLLLFFAFPSFADDAADVRACFQRYKDTLVAKDGYGAAALLAPESLAIYTAYKEPALHEPEAELRARPVLDQFFVLTYRMLFTAEELQAANEQDLVARAVEEGLIDTSSIDVLQIGEVQFEGDHAFGRAVANGRSTPLNLMFTRGTDCWLWDFRNIMQLGFAALEEIIVDYANEQHDGDLSAAVAAIIELARGTKVEPKHWQPLVAG